MRGRHIITPAAAATAAIGLAACGGASDNGVAGQSAPQIVQTATRAVQGVSSVHVTGVFTAGSAGRVFLDLRLVAGRGATGSMSEHGQSFRLVVSGDSVYINGSPGFWKQYAGAAAGRLQGKWLKASATSGSFAGLAADVRLRTLLADLLSGHGGLTKGARGTIDGHKVIAVHDQSKGGTLYVSTTGKPYPVEITNSANGGKVTFSDFDASVSLTPPRDTVSNPQLTR